MARSSEGIDLGLLSVFRGLVGTYILSNLPLIAREKNPVSVPQPMIVSLFIRDTPEKGLLPLLNYE